MSIVDRFTTNQDQNDQRPILHISSNTFHQRKCFVFVIFVCVIIRGGRILRRPPGHAHTCCWHFVASSLLKRSFLFAAVVCVCYWITRAWRTPNLSHWRHTDVPRESQRLLHPIHYTPGKSSVEIIVLAFTVDISVLQYRSLSDFVLFCCFTIWKITP